MSFLHLQCRSAFEKVTSEEDEEMILVLKQSM